MACWQPGKGGMTMFRIGQKVVCVDDECAPGRAWVRWGPPKLGAVYTVAATGLNSINGAGTCIAVEEIKGQYRASRFRPVTERKTETGMAILREILDRESHQDRVPERVNR